MKLPASLAALGHRNFRLFIVGQTTSQVGNWVQMVATSWLVYQLSGSTFMLGLSAFCQQIPFLLLTPMAGVFLDRLDLRRILHIVNSLALAQSVLLAVLVATGVIEAWHVIASNLVLGIGSAFEVPGRQSLLSRLLPDRRDLPNAIALNSTMMNGARFIGPAVGGLVTAGFGAVCSIALNAVLRTAVLVALAAMRLPRHVNRVSGIGWVRQMMAGVHYAYGFLPSRYALLLLAATSLCLQSYGSMMPWFASERFHGDSRTLGILMSAAGLGAAVGMVHLATRRTIRGLFRLVGWSATAASLSLIAFSLTEDLWLGVAMIFVSAMGMMLTAAATNTVLQTIVPDELRGRVAALYVMSFLGLSPLSALLTGWLARHVGAPWALASGGLAALLAVAVYSRGFAAIRREIEPLYDRLNIPRTRALPVDGLGR